MDIVDRNRLKWNEMDLKPKWTKINQNSTLM